MIFALRGIPTRVEPFFVIIECGGIGYGARIAGNVYEAIVSGAYDTQKKEFTLVTRSVYSEDNAQLFGFLTENEASLFDFIRSLNGFGPQAAMNIISTIGSESLIAALLSEDVAALLKVPGVGKTKAEKLCFEARSKKVKLEKLATGGVQEVTRADDLVVQALVSLGYAAKEIQAAAEKIKKAQTNLPVVSRENLQEWIRIYLKYL